MSEDPTNSTNCNVAGCKCEGTNATATWTYVGAETRVVDEKTGGEERIVDKDSGGAKGQKLARYDIMPARALYELAEQYGVGERKYPTGEDGIPNWRRGYRWSLSYQAAMRHLTQFWAGEDIDKESATKHVIAAAWHCLALATFMDEQPGKDDRFKKNE